MEKIIEYMHINGAVLRRVYNLDYKKSLEYFTRIQNMKKEGLYKSVTVSNYTHKHDKICCLVNVYRR